MVVVGEAASVAGLVSLAGQAVLAASSLYSFIKAYKNVHPQIQEVVSTLQALHICLSGVQRTALHANTVQGQYHPEVAEIFASVKSCTELFDQIEKRLDPIKNRVKRTICKKLKIAAEDGYFPSIYQQLTLHHQRLSTLLSTATWYTGLETLASLEQLSIAATEIKDVQACSVRQIRSQVTSMDSSLHLYMTQKAASENLLEQKINAILQATTSGATQNQLAAIEARLASLQNQCEQSINAPRSDILASPLLQAIQTSAVHDPKASDLSASPSLPAFKETTESLMSLVDTALVLRIQSGQVTYNLEPAKDRVFAALSIPQKKAMARYLHGLRLLLWLLRKENCMIIASCKPPQSLPSPSTREASMHSLTVYRVSYTVLDPLIGHSWVEVKYLAKGNRLIQTLSVLAARQLGLAKLNMRSILWLLQNMVALETSLLQNMVPLETSMSVSDLLRRNLMLQRFKSALRVTLSIRKRQLQLDRNRWNLLGSSYTNVTRDSTCSG